MYTEGKLLHTSLMLAFSLILMAVVAAQGWQRPCLKPVGIGTVTPLAQQPGFLRLLHRRQVQDQGAGSPISGMGLATPLGALCQCNEVLISADPLGIIGV